MGLRKNVHPDFEFDWLVFLIKPILVPKGLKIKIMEKIAAYTLLIVGFKGPGEKALGDIASIILFFW